MARFDLTDLYLLTVMAVLKGVQRPRSHRARRGVPRIAAELAYQLSRKQRRRSERTLARVFGDRVMPRERHKILRQTHRVFWEDLFGLVSSVHPDVSAAALECNWCVQGLEYLHRAISDGGRGAILIESPYFGARHLSKHLLHSRGFDIHQVYGPRHLTGFAARTDTRLRARTIRPFFERLERQSLSDLIYLPEDDSLAFTRELLNRLQRNAVLCLSGEGQIGKKRIEIELFGSKCPFTTGIMSLGRLSGAPVLPLFCWRESSRKANLVIEPPIDVASRTDAGGAGVAAFVRLLETYVRRHPGQYRGWHLP